MSGPLIANLETNPGKDTLNGVLRSPLANRLVLHYFATDCAERALLRLDVLGQPAKDQAMRTIQEKRTWLENTCQENTGPISSGMFLSYMTEVGGVGPRLGSTPPHVWRPLWAAEGAAGWCSRKEKPNELVQHVSALCIECAVAPYVSEGPPSRFSPLAPEAEKPDILEEVEAFTRCLSAEVAWQCARLAWWLSLAELTTRLWLAYTAACPLPKPGVIALDYGFDALPPASSFQLPSGGDAVLR